MEHRRTLSAGSAVFEGPPVPLISRGTPRRERAPSPGPPHCSVLFLYPRSPHSVKRRGTSSISPVPHVNRRFNQTLLSGLSLCSPSNTLTEREKRKSPDWAIVTLLFLFYLVFYHITSSAIFLFLFLFSFLVLYPLLHFLFTVRIYVFMCVYVFSVVICTLFQAVVCVPTLAKDTHTFRNKGGVIHQTPFPI